MRSKSAVAQRLLQSLADYEVTGSTPGGRVPVQMHSKHSHFTVIPARIKEARNIQNKTGSIRHGGSVAMTFCC